MSYRLDIEGTDLSLEFRPKQKELLVHDNRNPDNVVFLNEIGLAVLQYWLCMVDLHAAHRNRHTRRILHQMGLEIPSGICVICQQPYDDCGCLRQTVAADELTQVKADCGHMVTLPHICTRCGYMLCDICAVRHCCATFAPESFEDDDEEGDEDESWLSD